MIRNAEEDSGSLRRKLKFEKDGNYSLSIEHMEEFQVIFCMFMDLPISSLLNNNIKEDWFA